MSRGLGRGQGRVTPASTASGTYTPTFTQAGNTFNFVGGQFVKVPGMLHLWVCWQPISTITAAFSVSFPNGYFAATPITGVYPVVLFDNTSAGLVAGTFFSVAGGATTMSASSITLTSGRLNSAYAAIPTTT